jgi:hypothetical protein
MTPHQIESKLAHIESLVAGDSVQYERVDLHFERIPHLSCFEWWAVLRPIGAPRYGDPRTLRGSGQMPEVALEEVEQKVRSHLAARQAAILNRQTHPSTHEAIP